MWEERDDRTRTDMSSESNDTFLQRYHCSNRRSHKCGQDTERENLTSTNL